MALRITQLALMAVMIIGTVTMAAGRELYNGYEMPPYKVVDTFGNIELRTYEPHLLAKVTVAGSRSRAINRGFRELAGYIFGGNAADQKIAMTVPVTQTPAVDTAQGEWTVTFMMPEQYQRGDLPKANSEAITFVQAPASQQLVIQFSGLARDTTLRAQEKVLRDAAKAQGLRVIGTPRYHFYDGPMTLPRQRRNEVSLTVG